MARAFLDTTAVVNLTFFASRRQQGVHAATAGYQELITSDYVVFELAKGYLAKLLMLQRKLLQLKSLSDVVEYAGLCNQNRYHSGAILSGLIGFLQSIKTPTPLSDESMLIMMRGHLEMAIITGWQKVMSLSRVNSIGCKALPPDPAQNSKGEYRQELKGVKCGERTFCGLKEHCHHHKDTLSGIRSALLAGENQSAETLRRIAALRELYRTRASDFPKSACYEGGDALIAHEASLHADAVVTSNRKDFEVPTTALGFTLVVY